MSLAITLILCVLLAACALMIAWANELFLIIILLALLSSILMAIYGLVGAVDVAFTEAVVGVSISTVFLMMLARRLRSVTLVPKRRRPCLPALLAAFSLGAVLLSAVGALPRFGDPDSVMHGHVAKQYITRSMQDAKTPNVVTAVLADYRGFDTLIETAVVLVAALACLLVLGVANPPGRHSADLTEAFESVMLRTLMTPLVLITQFFAVYVVVHGHYSPGGGFQGGVLLAASFILPLLLSNLPRRYPCPNEKGAIFMAIAGVSIFALFAAFPLPMGLPMLDYSALPLGAVAPADRRSLGILGIEVGVMLAVAGSMLSIYYALRGGNQKPA